MTQTAMSITIAVLGRESISRNLAEKKSWLKKQSKKIEPLDKLQQLLEKGETNFHRSGNSERGSFMQSSLSLARFLRAAEAPADEIRAVLRDGIQVFAPVVPLFRFWSEQDLAVRASDAKRYDGREFDDYRSGVFLPPALNSGPRYKTVHVRIREQPAVKEMEKALESALIAWAFDGAKKMATAYQLRPACKGDPVNRFGLLREAILGNTKGAIAFLQNMPRGYDPDFPPERRELAEGVICGDEELVRAGLKATSNRFKTAWALKTYSTPARLKRAGTLENMIPDIRRHLIGHNWLMSDWGIAWMSLAWNRGMKGAFSDPGLFSEWLPWDLCCPGQSPVA